MIKLRAINTASGWAVIVTGRITDGDHRKLKANGYQYAVGRNYSQRQKVVGTEADARAEIERLVEEL